MVVRCLSNRYNSIYYLKSSFISSRNRLGPHVPRSCYASSATAPPVAFAFDIDGVLTQGSKVLPQAKRALRILNGENQWRRKFPYILMTNGGGKPESQRCRELSDKLDIDIDTTMFMQSHTIIGSEVLPYLERYQDKPIMVLGGVGDICRKITQSYGYKNVLTPIDALAWNPDLWPFYKMTEEESRTARNDFDFSTTPIHAIFVFHDPRNWGLDVQICLDLVRYGSQKRSAFATGAPRRLRGDHPVELIFCNPDLIWRGGYPKPRLGQGGFREAFQGVHQALEGRRYEATQLGKPSKETYRHAREMIHNQIHALAMEDDFWLYPIPYETLSIYMIGDNPESDIAGANGIGWKSVLVHTGVYSSESGPPTHSPTFEAEDVEEAVLMAIDKEVLAFSLM